MLANKFIDLLESENLLDPEMIEELRRQVAQSGNRLPVETLAKLLVDNEQLTKFQATRLVSSLKSGNRPASNPSAEDDLLIADVDSQSMGGKSRSDDDEVAVIVGDDDVEVVEIIDDDDFESELDMGDDDVIVADVVESTPQQTSARSPASQLQRPVRVSVAASEPKGRWQTMRTYGAFGLFLGLLTALIFLGFWFLKGTATEALEMAKASYEGRDYPTAIRRYEQFIESFPTHDRVSFSRLRIAIAKIRQATENSGDAFEGTKVSKAILPTLLDESQLSEVRGDLAGALINIGDRLVRKAETSKTNEERKTYVAGLKEQLEIIQNPQYIASQERKQNEPKINALEESRQRLLRDVQRSDDRAKTAIDMKAALEARDAVAAYQARQTLVRRYPQLQNDEELSNLLAGATQIVQEAVKQAEKRPEINQSQPVDTLGKRVLLTSNTGKTLNLNNKRTLFVRAKQSLYGINASDGKVLWRNFLASREMNEPLSISDNAVDADSSSDCILTMTEQGKIRRLAGATGQTKWEVDFGTRVWSPQMDRDALYVADQSGRVSCLDSETGQVRWCKQLPQAIGTSVSAGSTKQSIFVVGIDANIYTLSRRDGSCLSVQYDGHEPGTIVVPPLALLGRLLVFENIGPGFSQIRTMAISEDEKTLTNSQDPIRLRGHVVVAPEVEGRRCAVVTDLGEVSVFEVETISNSAELVKMASLVASELNPKTSWPLIAGNDLLVAANELTSYQIQASRQEIVRNWVRDDGDRFVARAIRLEDYVVHCRNVRGTEGIRITAMDAKTGNQIWETNVGVPVTSILQNDNAFAAITSQAALYNIEKTSLGSGQLTSPVANPGRNQRQMAFDRVAIGREGSFAAVNSERADQIAYFDSKANAEKMLSIISSSAGTGQPSGDPLWIADGIVIPMNNGQLIAVDPATGRTIGTPVQPPMEPGKKTVWSTPCLLADQRTLVAANSDKKLVRVSTGKQFSRLNEVQTAYQVIGQLAALENLVIVPTLGDQSSYLEIYDGVDLSRKATVAIDGRISWGVQQVDALAICYTQTEGLIAVDSKGERVWTAALKNVAPVGRLQTLQNDILLSTVSGDLFRIEKSSGKVISVLRTGESISGTPLVLGNGLLIPGDEGNVLAVAVSQFEPFDAATETSSGTGN